MHLLISLRGRVLGVVALFGLVTAVALALVMHQAVRSYYMDMVYQQSGSFLDRVIDTTPDLWMRYESDKRGFSDYLKRVTLYAPNSGLYLIGNDGQVLASSGEDKPFWGSYRVRLDPVRNALANDPGRPIYADDPDAENAQCMVAAREVKRGDQSLGWLYAVARSAELGGQMPELLRSYAIRTSVKVALVVLAIAVLLTMAILAVLTGPLVALTRVAEQVKHSGFKQELCDEVFPHCSRNDEVGRLSRAFRDMFDRLKLEMQRVTRTDALRREMVASVSHDLRTPLTALMGQLETVRLKRETLSEADESELIERALNNARHLQRLTDSLAELGKLDNPEFRAELEPIALGELADDIVQRHQTSARAKGIELHAEYADRMPLARVDAGLLERALSNLLDNALRVTPPGGKVTVRVTTNERMTRLEVADTGPGVADVEHERVFDRFYQASSHRDQRGSSGLGLAIVKRVAELHGGEVGLRSAPGDGAVFSMELPNQRQPLGQVA